MTCPARHGASALLVLAVGVLALAGCAGGEAARVSPFPPRPAVVDVDRLDPCAVVTESQRRSLGLSHGRPPTITLAPTGSRGCGWSDFAGGYNFTVQTLPTGAIESAGAEHTRLTEIAGFGAVEATSFGETTPICQLIIDAAETGSIRVQAQSVLYNGGRPRGFDVVCPRAAEFADVVMHTATTP